ncbi:hypothetical protein [Nocardioides alkalitolerans]|uniref:hypothetical protein n=1 Tax=Nocardioides alkalitolerans TaxID=281714 RepID=UPI0003F4E343|nr:hypothetical protein [Nocardioides alkalitolerans]
MITVPPQRSTVGGGPDVLDTQSPFYLRLFGQWLHLQGISTGSQLKRDRASDAMVSVDGYRTETAAPSGPRTWSMSMSYATPVGTIAALELASANPGDVWFVDRSLTRQNTLAPADCHGLWAPGATVILAGGIPLPVLAADRTVTIPVRAGVTTYAALWTTRPAGTVVGSATWPGGTAALTAPGGTAAQRAEVALTPDADGVLELAAVAGTTGLQVTEDYLPDVWHPGQRMPTQVAVADPARTLQLLGELRHGRASYALEVREVG